MIYMEVSDDVKTIVSGQFWCGNNTQLMADAACKPGSITCYVEASGDELEAIRRYITGVRMVPGKVVTWIGEDARFIIINLDLTKVNALEMKRIR